MTAAAVVPSLTPCRCPVNTTDKIHAVTTRVTSNPTFMYQNFTGSARAIIIIPPPRQKDRAKLNSFCSRRSDFYNGKRIRCSSAPDPLVTFSYALCPLGKDHPSIAMVFFVSTTFASFFGILSFRMPSSNFALMSSWVTASPT